MWGEPAPHAPPRQQVPPSLADAVPAATSSRLPPLWPRSNTTRNNPPAPRLLKRAIAEVGDSHPRLRAGTETPRPTAAPGKRLRNQSPDSWLCPESRCSPARAPQPPGRAQPGPVHQSSFQQLLKPITQGTVCPPLWGPPTVMVYSLPGLSHPGAHGNSSGLEGVFFHCLFTGTFRFPALELQGGQWTGLVCMPLAASSPGLLLCPVCRVASQKAPSVRPLPARSQVPPPQLCRSQDLSPLTPAGIPRRRRWLSLCSWTSGRG